MPAQHGLDQTSILLVSPMCFMKWPGRISGHIVHRLAYGSLVWDIYDARDRTSDACPPRDKVWWRQNAFTSGNGGFESSRTVSSPMYHPQLSAYHRIPEKTPRRSRPSMECTSSGLNLLEEVRCCSDLGVLVLVTAIYIQFGHLKILHSNLLLNYLQNVHDTMKIP
jgi:hypothetical protein